VGCRSPSGDSVPGGAPPAVGPAGEAVDGPPREADELCGAGITAPRVRNSDDDSGRGRWVLEPDRRLPAPVENAVLPGPSTKYQAAKRTIAVAATAASTTTGEVPDPSNWSAPGECAERVPGNQWPQTGQLEEKIDTSRSHDGHDRKLDFQVAVGVSAAGCGPGVGPVAGSGIGSPQP
jgi:hypothetical protein